MFGDMIMLISKKIKLFKFRAVEKKIPSSLVWFYLYVFGNLGIKWTLLLFLKRIFFIDRFFCLRLNLVALREDLRVRSDIVIDRCKIEDFQKILNEIEEYDRLSRKQILAGYLFFKRGYHGCYLGKNQQGEIVSMQWLLRPDDNKTTLKSRNRTMPILKKNEVCIENLYIFPKYRNVGFFTTLNMLILKIAKEEGYSICYSFIHRKNIKSLSCFLNIGFQIRQLVDSYNFFGFSWRSTMQN